MSSFSQELDAAFEVVVEGSITQTAKKTAAKVLQAVTSGTPVGNPTLWQNPDSAPAGYTGGHARRNWQVQVDTFTPKEIDGEDETGAATIAEGLTEVERFTLRWHHIINIHNSVPYIKRLNDGHSEQAPVGFIERAVQAATR